MKLAKTTNVLSDKKQKTIRIPIHLCELFDINSKDKFNWYIERKGDYVSLIGKLVKDKYRLNYYSKDNVNEDEIKCSKESKDA